MSKMVKCVYQQECSSYKKQCERCLHNHMRNYINDYFNKAEDNPIPEKCPKLSYNGPAEQTEGYKCPVCGCHTNPYQLVDGNCCFHCGYRLNI